MPRSQWLLVEDNPAEADLAREALSSVVGLELVIVGSGQEALSYLRRGADAACPSLVLLDLNLPGLSGEDVLAEVRADARLRPIPVIVLSSSESERDIAALYGAGANCYLTKPIYHADFVAMMQAITQFWLSVARLPQSSQ
jgi:two-component system, chemotaxis family, response regulator Rcp1